MPPEVINGTKGLPFPFIFMELSTSQNEGATRYGRPREYSSVNVAINSGSICYFVVFASSLPVRSHFYITSHGLRCVVFFPQLETEF